MISKSLENPMIAISVRVYQALLVAYPTKFQQEYGSHMLQVFRDCCLRTFHQGGMHGMARLWVVTFLDLLQSLVSEHVHKEIDMTKSKFVRFSGWMLILGAFVYYLFFPLYLLDMNAPGSYSWLDQRVPGWGFIYDLSFYGSPILLAIGMLGLRTRYGRAVGQLGRNILLISPVGIIISYIGLMQASIYDQHPLVESAGPSMLFICLTIFGLLSYQKKPMSRWNALPFIAGVWTPVMMVVAILMGAYEDPSPALFITIVTIAVAFYFIQFIALLMLGYILQSDVPEDVAATA